MAVEKDDEKAKEKNALKINQSNRNIIALTLVFRSTQIAFSVLVIFAFQPTPAKLST